MRVTVLPDQLSLARAAALEAAARIRAAVERGRARIVAATGTSQLAFLDHLTRERDLDWSKVELFHLDEYIGLPEDHPASFRRYLRERLIQPAGITRAHLIDGLGDPRAVCDELGRELRAHPVDLAMVGIGENGHLAFNDPPADFETERPYIVVTLDEACRDHRRGSAARDHDVHPPDSERARDPGGGARIAQGDRRSRVSRRRGVANGTGIDPSYARRHDALSRR
jgi:glucosamine-6-phosphate deaminase